MASPDAETVVVYHYDSETVDFYTTRVGEKNQLQKRLGSDNILSIREVKAGGKVVGWHLRMDIDKMRNPFYMSPVLT